MTIFPQTIDLQKMERNSYQADKFQLYENKIFFYGIGYPIKQILDTVISNWYSKGQQMNLYFHQPHIDFVLNIYCCSTEAWTCADLCWSCMCVRARVCVHMCVCMHVEKTYKFKCVMLFVCIYICVSVWVHVPVFADSSVSRILHLRVIDINEKTFKTTSE